MRNTGYSFLGFTSSKLERFLRSGGQEFTFSKYKTNNYEEFTTEIDKQITIFGVLHKSFQRSYVDQSSSDSGSTTRYRSRCSIITFWGAWKNYSGAKDLEPDMKIQIENETYKIVRSEDLNSWGIAAEITLEVYDEWHN